MKQVAKLIRTGGGLHSTRGDFGVRRWVTMDVFVRVDLMSIGIVRAHNMNILVARSMITG